MNTNNISVFLDVALSLTFFYFVASMFVSGIVEFINTIRENRAAFLAKALNKIENGFWDTLKATSFVKNLEDNDVKKWQFFGQRAISYLDSSTFVSAIFSIFNLEKDLTKLDGGIQQLKDKIASYTTNSDLKNTLITLANQSSTVTEFETKLAQWFNTYMEQVSGWFKRYSRLIVMGIALVVTVLLNLNSIVITKQLASDKDLRNSIVTKAVNYVNSSKIDTSKNGTLIYKHDSAFMNFMKTNYNYLSNKMANSFSKIDSIKNKNQLTAIDSLAYQEATAKYLESNIRGLGLKMGYTFTKTKFWDKFCEVFNQNGMDFWFSIIGWILTTAALSFGAPFWFDLLVKLVNVRNVMKKPDGN